MSSAIILRITYPKGYVFQLSEDEQLQIRAQWCADLEAVFAATDVSTDTGNACDTDTGDIAI